MTAAMEVDTQFVSGDFTTVIGDRSLDVFVGRIMQVHASTDEQSEHNQRTGTFTAQVVEILSRHSLQPGSTVTIAFRQDVSFAHLKRPGANAWNAIKVEDGHTVLLAARSTDGGHTWRPRAVVNADGAHTPDVDTVRTAYRIENAQGEEKLLLLGRALESPSPVLLQYALHALGVRNVLGRGQAIHLMSFSLISTAVSPDNRDEIASALADLFQDSDVNEQARSNILGALAQAMVREKDGERQGMLAAYLRSCLLSRAAGNDQHRMALVKTVTAPPAAQVIQALKTLGHGETDPEERTALLRMADLWEAVQR